MPVCPKCGKDIDHLVILSVESTTATWSPKDGYDVDFTEVEAESWRCLECVEGLFKDEDEAMKFFVEVS